MLNYKLLIIISLLWTSSCEFGQKNYFPSSYGLKWVYSVAIKSSYTGKSSNKRVMITNFYQSKKNKVEEFSKLYSDGSYYSYEIRDGKVERTSVILTFSEGIDEPVKKIIYPDLTFKQKEWRVKEQLFLVRGFQPPLLNVKPRSQLEMYYKIKKRHKRIKFKNTSYDDCIEIEGTGNTKFIGDTRSGPINVEVRNNEILCNNIGLIKQVRTENTNASAFGNMTLTKNLMSFK